MYDEREKEKQATKIFYRTAKIAGYGIGLFVLAFIMPFINETDITLDLQELFVKYGFYALICVVVVVITYVFIRKKIFLVDGVLKWLVLPTIAVLLAVDVYTVMTSERTPIKIEIPEDNTIIDKARDKVLGDNITEEEPEERSIEELFKDEGIIE